MREILFRAKRVDNGEWVISDCIYQCGGIVKLWDEPSRDGWVEVIPETVGQYTGLKDKNGKKIFEGDILKAITVDTNSEQNAVVGFGNFVDENNSDEYLGFYIEFDGVKTTITQLLLKEVKDCFEVIGNVFDNPELLEVQDE